MKTRKEILSEWAKCSKDRNIIGEQIEDLLSSQEVHLPTLQELKDRYNNLSARMLGLEFALS